MDENLSMGFSTWYDTNLPGQLELQRDPTI